MSLRGSYMAHILWSQGGTKIVQSDGTLAEIAAEIEDVLHQEARRTSGDLQPQAVHIVIKDFEPADQRGPMDLTEGPIADNE